MLFEVTGWSVSAEALKPETSIPQTQLKKKKKRDKNPIPNNGTESAGHQLFELGPPGSKRQKTEKVGVVGRRNRHDDGDNDDGYALIKDAEEKPKISPEELQSLYDSSIAPGNQKDQNEGRPKNQGNLSAITLVADARKKLEYGDSGKKKKRKRGKKESQEGYENAVKRDNSRAKTNDDRLEEERKTDQEPPVKKRKTMEKSRGSKAAAPVADEHNTSTSTKKGTYEPSSEPLTLDPFPSLPLNSKLTPLQQKMRAKLTSARFRHINETLYTTPSALSFLLFQQQPEMFKEYHAGFRQQVEVWPENPVNIFIGQISKRARLPIDRKSKVNKASDGSINSVNLPLPSTKHPKTPPLTIIADLGCGDATIARTFMSPQSPLPNSNKRLKILSYDLSDAQHPGVVKKADIANLPLENESVDIAIFCLALMGTNYLDFIKEAVRVLRYGGECWVAEIKSRFSSPVKLDSSVPSNKGKIGVKKTRKGKIEEKDNLPLPIHAEGGNADDHAVGFLDDTEVYKPFIQALAKRGLQLRGTVDATNKMFVRMEFVKVKPKEDKKDSGEDYEFSEVSRAGRGAGKRDMPKNMKFLEETEDEIRKREEMILKPCVYKSR